MSFDKEEKTKDNLKEILNEDSTDKLFNKNNNEGNNSNANNLTLKTLSISSINSSSNSTLNSDMNIEQFDFSKTGAKPKIKSSQQSSSCKQKSSKSSYTSSSMKTDQMDIDDENLYSNAINDVDDINRNNYFKLSRNNNNNNGNDVIDQLQLLDDFTEIAECPLCGKIVKKNLEKHFELEHKEYECPFCGLLYDCESILKEHIDNVHQFDDASTASNNFDIGVFDYKLLKNDEKMEDNIFNKKNIDKISNLENENIKSFTCPICNINIQDQTWLELHVDSHFNSNNFQNECLNENAAAACSLQRTCSNSSLTANIDDNFEIDQVMTLAECDNNINDNDKSNLSERENACSTQADGLMCAKDYQLAQMLERQEQEKLKYNLAMEQQLSPFKNIIETNEQIIKDNITAQLIERQELESLKYNNLVKISEADASIELKENSNKRPKYSKNYDDNMTDDEELEWLRNKYGMTNLDTTTKAKLNLDRALKTQRIDPITYNLKISSLKSDLENIYDDGTTKTTGLIDILNCMNFSKWMLKRYLCTYCDHYGTGILDTGYGCGYRNTQMLLSSIRVDAKLRDILFNNNNLNIPSVNKIQKLIEKAWEQGFDRIGKEQFNGQLVDTVKWIGASDIATLLSFLKIKVELVDIFEPKNHEPISKSLFNYVKNYFEKSKGHIHPIYIQHQGHSRTIVGIEIGKNNTMNLIIFDPGTRTKQIENFKNDPFKFMYIFRKGENTFKHKQYQLLVIKDIIDNDIEYESSKILKSIRLN